MFDTMIRSDGESRRDRVRRFLRAVGVLAASTTLFGILILAMLLGE